MSKMIKENHYNLIDEPWIPIAGKGLVGLKAVFSDDTLPALGGNPVEKIAVFKLLLAIAQSAITPKNESEWRSLGCKGMQDQVLKYLDQHHDLFYLYGEHPFLQMLEIEKANKIPYGALLMEVASGNTTVVTQIQTEKELSDAQKAMLVVNLMGFALGGKKTDNSIVLTPGYNQKSNDKGKPASGKFGSSIGFMGLLHSFFFAENISNSIYLNLMNSTMIDEMKIFPKGIGIAPWQKMPTGEDDAIAKDLKNSYMGRLVPMNRFLLLTDDGVHYSEGIAHFGYADHMIDPSFSVDFDAKPKPKVLWVDPEKRPWRQLSSLLSFLNTQKKSGFVCYQLSLLCDRCRHLASFSVWSGGVKVSSNAGEQYLTGTDDFVESEVQLSSAIFGGQDPLQDASLFFSNLVLEMDKLERLAKTLKGSVSNYNKSMMVDADNIAAQSTNIFWQLCESQFQKLVEACENVNSEDVVKRLTSLRKTFSGYVTQIYNQYCPNQTARQLEAWAKNKPFFEPDFFK